jgi:hypothetical protein
MAALATLSLIALTISLSVVGAVVITASRAPMGHVVSYASGQLHTGQNEGLFMDLAKVGPFSLRLAADVATLRSGR